ncbi:MAG: YbjQ family protein [Defluviitaleaceae bacterium]|nr:YbjQ family protein [Defluviitaleaceae bacterium]
MILVNTDFITGKNLQTLELVNGWGLLAFGINLQKAAQRANAEMEEAAKEMGADAIINVRYSFGGGGTNCVLATGTAVKFV